MDGEDIAAKLAEHDSKLDVAERRLNQLEACYQQQNDLIISVNRLADSMDHMCREQTQQGERLAALEGANTKQWADTRRAFINAFVGAISAAIAGAAIWLVYFIVNNGGL